LHFELHVLHFAFFMPFLILASLASWRFKLKFRVESKEGQTFMTTASPKETKTRRCQACGESYEYPLPGAAATRFHCDNCAGLPERARKAMGRLMTRVRALEKAVAELEKKAAAGNGRAMP
jgi:hypothetical protein